MSHYKENIDEHYKEVNKALNTTDLTVLKQLLNSKSVGVRRALAQNNSINSEIANCLAYDPVLNVSYIATLNQNCTVKREFNENDLKHKCVICTIAEKDLNCTQCDI